MAMLQVKVSTIALNFPNSDELISRKIESLVKDMDINKAIAATQLGCQFESQLHQAFSCTKNLVITYGKPEVSVTLTVNFCSTLP